MIQQYGDIVTFMYIFAHSSILRRKRRGIYPKEIQLHELKNEFLKNELAKLNEKLIFLQGKLKDLKLTLDKTLGGQSVNQSSEQSTIAELPTKKVFKNLDAKTDQVKVTAPEKSAIRQWFDSNTLLSVLALGALCCEKYRVRRAPEGRPAGRLF